jgi:hypothetical protein
MGVSVTHDGRQQDLSALTILIDKGITTHEEAAQRIELLHSAMQADPEHSTATALVQAATGFLRSRAQKAPPAVLESGRKDDLD